eukprot:scaffold6550_cov131-Isochrysis_galbana.AAC.11
MPAPCLRWTSNPVRLSPLRPLPRTVTLPGRLPFSAGATPFRGRVVLLSASAHPSTVGAIRVHPHPGEVWHQALSSASRP